MTDTLTHIYKYPRVLTDVPTHIIDVWNLNIGGGGDGPQTYWDTVVQVVRSGNGPAIFPIGTEFTVNKTLDDVTYPITFVVRDHDHYQMADPSLTHSMVLETKYVYGSATAYKSLIFDAREALYYAAAGLEAGAYSFTVKDQAWYPEDNNVTFYFTLTQDVPAGGQLVISAQYNQSMQDKQMRSYPSVNSTTAMETVVLSSTEIPGAVNLGATDGQTENMNFLHRIVIGSNNYAQSNLRQWLNSEGNVNTYYTAQTKFDRPNGNLIGSDTAYAGFAHGFGDDFLNAVKATIVPYRTNDVYEVDSLDGTVQAKSTVYNVKDKFFLLSRPEIYGSWDSSSLKDGEQLEFYVGLTNTERIKYDSFGSARRCWLRSPFPSFGGYVRYVNTDGSLDNGSAINGIGATVACVIA